MSKAAWCGWYRYGGIGVTIVVATVYGILTGIPWLNNLGRASRSKADTHVENLLSHLSKLAIEHEHDEHTGNPRFVLATRATEIEEDE